MFTRVIVCVKFSQFSLVQFEIFTLKLILVNVALVALLVRVIVQQLCVYNQNPRP